jgi:hypothetical protein
LYTLLFLPAGGHSPPHDVEVTGKLPALCRVAAEHFLGFDTIYRVRRELRRCGAYARGYRSLFDGLSYAVVIIPKK